MSVGPDFTKPPADTGSTPGGNGNTKGWDDAEVQMPKFPTQITVDTTTLAGVASASDPGSTTWNYRMPKSWANSMWDNMDAPGAGYMTPDMHAYVEDVAKAIDYRKTGAGLWADAVEASANLWTMQQIRKSPFQIIAEWASVIGPGKSGGGSGSGGGAAAPQAADPSTIRRMMDQISTTMLGRTLSDKEFKHYYQSYVSGFNGNNNMDPQQHAMDAVRGQGDYEEYQVATKFASALQSVLKGAI